MFTPFAALEKHLFKCINCGVELSYRNPLPTVDTIIYHAERGIVLIRRRFEPIGWALPGGFIDYGETVENAAIREAKEETSLDVTLQRLIGVYSDPKRDPRKHTMSTVFYAKAQNPDAIKAGDDAGEAVFFALSTLPEDIVFDHKQIIADFEKMLPELERSATSTV